MQFNPIHLVLGDSAAGCLRAACSAYGLPGQVIGFSDDLTHGPINDSDARVSYLRSLPWGLGESELEYCAPFSQWQVLFEHLNSGPVDALIIWLGDNVADHIFLAMACDRLAQRPEPLWQVRVPGFDSSPFVTMHSPAQLSQLYLARQVLGTAERQSLAQDFVRIRDTCGPVRCLEQGKVVGVPIDYFDSSLLEACGPDWLAAMQVVGTAMGRCNGANVLSDTFYGSRLGFLVDAGRVEAKGSRTGLRDGFVRLPVQCPEHLP